MNNPVYILSIAQISAQKPLCEDWIENPIFYKEEYVRAIEPDYKEYFPVLEVRRYGKLLKRALLVSRKAAEQSNIKNPDAIITGTGLGCIENTELFLKDLTFGGEKLLKPTHFMNSTHNTISSLVAIDAKCHEYNSTYVQKGVSFESALQDAFMQLKSGKINTALIGGYDEMTPDYFQMLKKTGYLDFSEAKQCFASETALAMMLSTGKTDYALCKIEQVETVYENHSRHSCENANSSCFQEIAAQVRDDGEIDAIMIGTNGQPENDCRYYEVCEKMFPTIPLLHYKPIFGENYTAPALGIYAATMCLKNGKIPEHLLVGAKKQSLNTKAKDISPLRKILFYNHFEGKYHSLILLSKC
jgi:3-oxoacyl-(acyl-carrier-protein) synthase